MADPILDAPPEIRGRPAGAHRVRRLAWVRDQLARGHTQAQISVALGISPESVNHIVNFYGFSRSVTVPVAPMGRLSEAFEAAPIRVRHAMMRLADERKTTVADAAMLLASKGMRHV